MGLIPEAELRTAVATVSSILTLSSIAMAVEFMSSSDIVYCIPHWQIRSRYRNVVPPSCGTVYRHLGMAVRVRKKA
jgi:hypothetical protein